MSSSSNTDEPGAAGAAGRVDALFDALFPLGFAIAPDLTLARVGPRLTAALPAARVGEPVLAVFEVLRPRAPLSWSLLGRLTGVAWVFRARANGLELRGQCLMDDGLARLAVGPSVNSSDELARYGLSLGDFAPHDARLDLLVLVSAKETALADAQALATRLRELNAREAARAKLLQSEIVRQEWVASLGRLVAGVAHEVNTPLGVALTAASLAVETNRSLLEQATSGQLRKREFERLTQDLGESLALVEGNLRRAADLVRQFKQVAVDQTGSARRRIEVGGYVRDVAESLRPMLRGRSVALELVTPARIEADIQPGALSQIVTNLLQNALTHAFPDDRAGVVTLAVEPAEDGRCKLTCRDDGVGIPEDVVDHVFQPFFTTRLGQGGSGLGLFIVHNLAVDTLHGAVTVTSARGHGTAFEVVFPTAFSDA